jgi:hypothetical protein
MTKPELPAKEDWQQLARLMDRVFQDHLLDALGRAEDQLSSGLKALTGPGGPASNAAGMCLQALQQLRYRLAVFRDRTFEAETGHIPAEKDDGATC